MFSEQGPPNVLWIVWDTVRADHMSLYGYHRSTTPFVDKWAEDALVFENCLSISSTTVPSHVSMFTNQLPSEHGADNTHCHLGAGMTTLPEIFQQNGYQTCLYSENPYISGEVGFGQGFDVVFHPWESQYRNQVVSELTQKIPQRYRNPRLTGLLHDKDVKHWALTACGNLGRRLVTGWLDDSESERPFFVFMNLMEAHLPIISPEIYRQRMMTPRQVEQSYSLNTTPPAIWSYTFNLSEYTTAERELITGTYDAALAELDELFERLLTSLEQTGKLDNTIVILSADHGEHLGEHHLLDHQFSLYQELLAVPLVIHYPAQIKSGRNSLPVTNIDIYPTLLDLAGISSSANPSDYSISLLAPVRERARIADYPTAHRPPIDDTRREHPDWDPTPYLRSMKSIQIEPYKYIHSSDDRHELYNIIIDPRESRNLFVDEAEIADGMSNRLTGILASGRQPTGEIEAATMSEEQRRALESMGYIGSSKKTADTTDTAAPVDTTSR